MTQAIKPDFAAFQAIHDALEPLDNDARRRVVKSVITLLGIDAPAAELDEEVANQEAADATEKGDNKAPSFATFAELFAAANPNTNGDKALVAGYWLQVCKGDESFTAQEANRQLNHLGERVANITAGIDNLRAAKPQLVLQLKKSGTSRQARKVYQVSHAGVQRVQEMIRG